MNGLLDRTRNRAHGLRNPRPVPYAALCSIAVAVPGTSQTDRCVLVGRELRDGFLDLSLWVKALSIHEWSLFTESVAQASGVLVRRGDVYTLLTDRPDNRRPLDWERMVQANGANQVDLLMMERRFFDCPWTGESLRRPVDYDLDHLLPVSVYPINELWNLAPTDRRFNQHVKRDRLPLGQDPQWDRDWLVVRASIGKMRAGRR